MAKTLEDIITDVLEAEGGSKVTNDPLDEGGRTQYGIAEKHNPQAWADGKVTEAEARAIYEQKYVKGPRFDQILDPMLQAQLIDFGVNSGPMVAIMRLQEILRVVVDGSIGPETLLALKNHPPEYVNNRLVVARVKLIGRIVSKNPSQIKWINGWLNRACEFIV